MSSFVRAFSGAVLFVLLVAAPALAQAAQEPEAPAAGQPWYFWLGVVALGLTVLMIMQMVVMYLIQSRGFDKVPDRRG